MLENYREPALCSACGGVPWRVAFYYAKLAPEFLCKLCLIRSYEVLPDATLFVVRDGQEQRQMFADLARLCDWLFDEPAGEWPADVREWFREHGAQEVP